jgi:arsenate reductase
MTHETSKKKILFLCTGNSCRSQMAEAWTRHLHGEVIDPYSAAGSVCRSEQNDSSRRIRE